MKLQKPKIIGELEKLVDINEFMESDRFLEKLVEDELIESKEETGFTIDSCIFKNVVFDSCSFRRIDLIDCRFENCDLSNVDFSGGSIERCEFINCKLLGSIFTEGVFKNVLFKDCFAKYINYSFSRFNNLLIEGCNMEESVLQEVNLKNTVFEKSSFANGFFDKTPLKDIDFTTCEIAGISVGIEDIKGAVVTAVQGLELTRLLSLVIK